MLERLFALFGYRIFVQSGFRIRFLPLEESAGANTRGRPAPVDVREQGNDPRSLGYHEAPVLVEAPLAHGRDGGGHALNDPKRQSPFVQASRVAAQGGGLDDIRDALLQGRPSPSQPSLLKSLGLTREQAPRLAEFDGDPFALAVRPWDPRSPEELRRKRGRKKSKRKRLEQGETPETWATRHAGRFQALVRSVLEHGLLRNDGPSGDIEAIALVRPDGSWRWQARKGHHRIAAFSALEYEKVPVRITHVVREDEAPIWPNVANGLFPEDAARDIFARLFDGTGLANKRA